MSAALNAPCVDNAIKAYQTRGIYVGPRHIHRRPFEVCQIPQYDPNNPKHQQLTVLSQAAQSVVAKLDLSEGGVVAVRKRAREATYIFSRLMKLQGICLGLHRRVALNKKTKVWKRRRFKDFIF